MAEIDWAAAGRKLGEIQGDLAIEHCELRGDEYRAETLRRLWTRIGCNWVTREEHDRVLECSVAVARSSAEQARKTLQHHTAEYERKLADARGVLAEAIRARCNEVTVPSRYRREGALLAADWLDGGNASTEGAR